MPHPLSDKIGAVRRRARWTSLIYGAGWALAIALIALLVAGVLDFVLRIDYRPVRLLITAAMMGAMAVAVYRFLLPQLTSRLTDVMVAQRIQQRFPRLLGKIASAVEFLKQDEDDAWAGSGALRRAVVVEASADVDRYPIMDVVDYRPAIRASLGAVAGITLVVGMAFCFPATTGIALARLANPFSDTVWPRINHLVFRNPPARLPSGRLFEVELTDHNGRLPDDVVIQYRFDEQEDQRIVAESMDFIDGVMVAQRENVRRPFSYRAVGGDDQTPWHPLEIVEAPRVQSLQVTLTPPDYTGWPPSTSSGRVVGLVGTQIQIECAVTKPVTSAMLITDNGQSISAEVSDDGWSIKAPASDAEPWILKETGTYSIALVDTEQIKGGETDKWQLRAIADDPPAVTIERPIPELHVTAAATVPVTVFVKDALAIRDISLNYLRSDQSEAGQQVIPLYEGPARIEPISEQQQIASLAEGDRRTQQFDWDLAALDLPPGTQITLHASAHDYQPVEGKSEPAQHIYVVSTGELTDRLARRQTAILGELMRALERERDARSRTKELEIQLSEVGAFQEPDVHRIQGLELAQREVRRSLTGQGDGVLKQIDGLLDDLERNKVNSPEMVRKLAGLGQLLRRLDVDHLAPAELQLIGARKTAQTRFSADDSQDTPSDAEPTEPKSTMRDAHRSLSRAGEHQDGVIAALEEALGDLQRWDNYRRFARDLAGLENEQKDIKRATDAMRSSTLGRDVASLTPQQRADLKKIAERQFELSRNFDKTLDGMEQSSHKLQETDPLAAASIADAADHARRDGISGSMRSAGQNVQRNQVGQAAGRQQSIQQGLEEMIDILSNRREQELSRLVKKLREAEAELRELDEQHKGLKKKLKDAAKITDKQQRERQLKRLAKEQRELQQKMQRLARRLQRLRAEGAGRKLAGAAGRVGKSSEAGQGGDAAGANEQADRAEQELKDAQQQLARARRQAEAELASEQIAKLQDQIKGLIDREDTLLGETQRLEQLREQNERLSRGQRSRVADLARQQLQVNEDTREMSKSMAGAPVFQLALNRAADNMQAAAERLGQLDTGAATQRKEQQAISSLQLLIKALAKDKDAGQKDGGGGGQGGGGQQGGGRVRSLAEIKLLSLMQQDLNARLNENRQAIDDHAASGQDVAGLLDERIELARHQGQIADLTVDLLDPGDEPAADDPENLPDLDEDNADGDLLPQFDQDANVEENE